MKTKLFLMLILLAAIACLHATDMPLLDLNGNTIEKVVDRQVIAIWPPDAPGIHPEILEKAKPCSLRFYNIQNPNLTVFKPENPNGTAIVLCSGGGFEYVATGIEGGPVAEKLNEVGVTVFVLKYRLPKTNGRHYDNDTPLSDGQRAIQLVRYHADKFEINPNKIGIMGFSAGGYLAETAGTSLILDVAKPDSIDETDGTPDFRILVYSPFLYDVAHSGEITQPTLLIHAKDDDCVDVSSSKKMFDILKKNQVPVEMHLYHGGHGFGAGREGTDSVQWIPDCIQWMRKMHFFE